MHVARVDLLNAASIDVPVAVPHSRLLSDTAMLCQVMLLLLLLNEDPLAASPQHRECLGQRWRAALAFAIFPIAQGVATPCAGLTGQIEELPVALSIGWLDCISRMNWLYGAHSCLER